MRQTVYQDLMEKFENPIEHTCNVVEGQQWISENGQRPEGMCPSAWESMQPFVESLARGEGNFFAEKTIGPNGTVEYSGGWMKNPMSAMISCNDGFRPFSFYVEVIDARTDQMAVAKKASRKSFALAVALLALSCACHDGKTNQAIGSDSQTEAQVSQSASPSERKITAEMAYEGVNNYCHKEYNWSIAKDNPDIMYVQMGEETDSVYQVVFRSYTGAFVYFHVDKANGTTRMVEKVPSLGIEEESGTFNLFDYVEDRTFEP